MWTLVSLCVNTIICSGLECVDTNESFTLTEMDSNTDPHLDSKPYGYFVQKISQYTDSDLDPYSLFLYRAGIRICTRICLWQCKWAITETETDTKNKMTTVRRSISTIISRKFCIIHFYLDVGLGLSLCERSLISSPITWFFPGDTASLFCRGNWLARRTR